MFGLLKKRRRRRLLQLPLDERERGVVERHVPYVRFLSEDARRELGGLIRVFLAEKSFEGCAGLEVTEFANEAGRGLFSGFGGPLLVGAGLLGLFLISRSRSKEH